MSKIQTTNDTQKTISLKSSEFFLMAIFQLDLTVLQEV